MHVAEEEVERGVFSPQCNAQACVHQGDPASFSTMDFESNSSSDPSSTRKGEPYTNQELLLSDSLFQDCGTCTLIEISDGNSDVIRNVAIEEKNCKQVSVADVLCSACKQLLYHPVVLNCGHGTVHIVSALISDQVSSYLLWKKNLVDMQLFLFSFPILYSILRKLCHHPHR